MGYDGWVVIEVALCELMRLLDALRGQVVGQVFALGDHIGDELVDVDIVGVDVRLGVDGGLVLFARGLGLDDELGGGVLEVDGLDSLQDVHNDDFINIIPDSHPPNTNHPLLFTPSDSIAIY